MLKKRIKICTVLALGTAMIFTSSAFAAQAPVTDETVTATPVAQASQSEGFYLQDADMGAVRVYGSVTKMNEEQILLKNDEESSSLNEIVLNISDKTMILDAVTGEPASLDQIKDGDTIYAYAGPAMTRSLPPQSNAVLLLCNVAQDYAVPHYVEIQSVLSSDDNGVTVSTDGNINLTFSKDCELTAYLTKNVVSTQDLIPGTKVLAWYSQVMTSEPAQAVPSKAILFPYEYAGYAQLTVEGDLYANGEKLALDANTEVYKNEEGIIMLPLRKLCDSFGYTVGWDKTARAASVTDASGTQLLIVSPDQTTTFEDQSNVAVASALKNGTTYISAADVQNLLNITVTQK